MTTNTALNPPPTILLIILTMVAQSYLPLPQTSSPGLPAPAPSPIRRAYIPLATLFAILTLYLIPIPLLPSSLSSSLRLYPPSLPITYPPLPPIFSTHFPDLALPASLRHPALEPLAERLNAFLARPIRGYSLQSIAFQEERCSVDIADRLVNPDQYNNDVGFWRGVDEDEVIARRAKVVQWFEEEVGRGEKVLGAREEWGVAPRKQGVVMTAGNADTTLRTITSIRLLRATGSDLPIEVFHYPTESIDGEHRAALEELGATVRQVSGVHKDEGAWKDWQIKGVALLQSSFTQLLYLDSDNAILSPPERLFTHPLFRQSGAVFWPDLSKDHPENAIWRIMGDQCAFTQWTFESGQILLDKDAQEGLVGAMLVVVVGMLRDRDFWYHMAGGDKDVFRWSARTLGVRWEDPPNWMGSAGFLNRLEGGRFCGHTTLQFDLDEPPEGARPKPLFMHSNLLKHFGPYGLGRGDVFTHIKHWPLSSYSSPHLNYAHTHTYSGDGRGMCLDLEWHPLAADRLTDAERERWKPETVDMRRVDWEAGRPVGPGDNGGDRLEGWEGRWWDAGGRVGGW